MDVLLKPKNCKSISEVREQIDIIDHELIRLFAIRYEYVKSIVKFKEKTTEAIVAEKRKDHVIEQRSEWANECGLDKETFAEIFKILIDHNISKEFEILKAKEIKTIEI